MVSERCGRLASSAKGFRGPASTLGRPVRGSSSHRAGGSAATPTQYGLRWREDGDRPFFHRADRTVTSQEAQREPSESHWSRWT